MAMTMHQHDQSPATRDTARRLSTSIATLPLRMMCSRYLPAGKRNPKGADAAHVKTVLPRMRISSSTSEKASRLKANGSASSSSAVGV